MILIFLVILIVTLMIANVLVSSARPAQKERGFTNPAYETIDDPEVIENGAVTETALLVRGNITATNKKIELLSERLNTIEKVVMTLVEGKVSEANRREIEE